MIISEKHKYVFISTPKCGTHTMFKLLTTYFDGKRIKTNGFHSTIIPKHINVDEYTIFTTVRNPYDRLVALWHSILYVRDDYINSWSRYVPDKSLESFSKLLANNQGNVNKIKARMSELVTPQYLWVKNMPATTIYLHIENINEEFNRLNLASNIQYNIPHELKRSHVLWSDVKNDNLVRLANMWAGNDFDVFNYQKESVDL